MHADRAIERTADSLLVNSWTERRELRSISRALSVVPHGSTVLNVPCGTGSCFEPLLQRGCRVTCADSSEHAIEAAAHRWKKVAEHGNFSAPEPTFVLTEPRRTGFPNRYFDAVICTGMFDHLDSSDRRIEALQELRRVSRGPVILSFCNAFALGAMRLTFKRARSSNSVQRRIPVPVWAFLNDLRRAGLNPVARNAVLWGISPLWHIVSAPATGKSGALLFAPRAGAAKAA
jgi:2-polyprenyl-3-methyl-5-hydroxy-6-metoxy-1,4-benzoquinol methylase